MKTRFELTILQPQISACSENPENMMPHELGKFCLQCNKAVHDLREMDADALISYLQKNEGESICASVKSNVLNKPVLQLNKLQKEYAYQFKFILALFFVFGPFLFSCNEQDYQEIKKAIAISIEDKGETYLPQVATPESVLRYVTVVDCECIYEEEPEIILADTTNREILLDPVYIYGTAQSKYDESCDLTITIDGAISFLTKRIITEIDTSQSFQNKITLPQISNLSVFPNPARNEININYQLKENGIAILSLFNINGQKIFDLVSTTDAESGNYSEQYNVSDLPSGMYIFILVNNDQKEVFRLNVTH